MAETDPLVQHYPEATPIQPQNSRIVLREALFGPGQYDTYHAPVISTLSELDLPRQADVSGKEEIAQTLTGLRDMVRAFGPASRIARDMPSLFALIDRTGIRQGAGFSAVASIHYNLALRTILNQGDGSEEQQAYLAPHIGRLDSGEALGVFLMTELGYGSNAHEIGTTATLDPEKRTFTLDTPDGPNVKFMPNVGATPDVPKVAVVAARLMVGGQSEGVFPFVVPIDAETQGVEVYSLPCQMMAMGNAMTRFSGLEVPEHALLAGGQAGLAADGSFVCAIPPTERFLATIAEINTGRALLPTGAIAAARAGLWLTLKYAQQRETSGGTMIIERDNVRQDLASSVSQVYAMTALSTMLRSRFAGHEQGTEPSDNNLNLLAMITKPTLSGTALAILQNCRERCGAQGMFRINRISDMMNGVQGVITAEGENRVMQITAYSLLKMLRDPHALPVAGTPDTAELPEWHQLLAERSQTLLGGNHRNRVTSAIGREPYAVETVEAVADRLAADSLAAVIAATPDGQARDLLTQVATVYGLERVKKHALWYVLTGCLTPANAFKIESQLAAAYRQVADNLDVLTDAFGIPEDFFADVPIAGDYQKKWLSMMERRVDRLSA